MSPKEPNGLWLRTTAIQVLGLLSPSRDNAQVFAGHLGWGLQLPCETGEQEREAPAGQGRQGWSPRFPIVFKCFADGEHEGINSTILFKVNTLCRMFSCFYSSQVLFIRIQNDVSSVEFWKWNLIKNPKSCAPQTRRLPGPWCCRLSDRSRL